MKIKFIGKYVILFIILTSVLLTFDYINLPSLLGFEMSNINWEFCMGFLNIIMVISLFVTTYKILDKKTIEREKNKREISFFLLKSSYLQCKKDIETLNQEVIEKYIVPKIDFNSTNVTIIGNLQKDPFINDNIIMDLVKDGQISKAQIEGYFKVKEKFSQYINLRIICFDGPHIYEPLKDELYQLLSKEMRKIEESTLNL